MSMSNLELREPKERKEIPDPESVFLLSPVFQPKWYQGEINPDIPDSLSDKVRGDLIIGNLKLATNLGYSVILIHSPIENPEFIKVLKSTSVSNGKNKVIVRPQFENGYSQTRREAIREAEVSGCKVQVMLEMEKPMIQHIPAMVQPILYGRADVTITNRQIITTGKISNDPEKEGENLRGLPVYQARSEYAFSVWTNNLLKKIGIMPQDFPFIDWMGNRAWRNNVAINSKFLARYNTNPERPIFDIDPDQLSSSLFYPLATILWERKLKLLSIPIDYQHPKIQFELENSDPSFIIKRDNQRNKLKREMIGLLKLLLGKTSSVKKLV